MPDLHLEPYKRITRKVYERHAASFERWYTQHFQQYVKKDADSFLKSLRGKTVIDLGSGPGTHAQYFLHKGLDVTCVDYSKEMLKRCAAKGVKALLVDIEHFWMPDATVDGIWMYSVLSHIKANEIPGIVENVARMLKPKGVLGLSVREGKKDYYEYFDEKTGDKRWFNHFQEQDVLDYFAPYFTIEQFTRTAYDKDVVYLNYLMRKK